MFNKQCIFFGEMNFKFYAPELNKWKTVEEIKSVFDTYFVVTHEWLLENMSPYSDFMGIRMCYINLGVQIFYVMIKLT